MKISQKKFLEVLAERVKKHGFKLKKEIGWFWIREKCTGRCPVSAVATELGFNCSKEDYGIGYKELGLPAKFINAIVGYVDNPDKDYGNPKNRQKLLEILNIKGLTHGN